MKHVFLIALPLMALSCTPAPYRDPDVNLKELTQPQTVAQPLSVVPPAPPPPVSAPEPSDRWRVWVPKRVAPNGDVVEGHYLMLSLTEPPLEVLVPAKPMPRAPHGAPLRLPPSTPAQRQSSGSTALPPTPLPAQPAPESFSQPSLRPLPPGAPSFGIGVD